MDPVAFMKARLAWRYAKGTPQASNGRMYLGNSVEKLGGLSQQVTEGRLPNVNLLFTSPPYHAITNYHYDQWLRIWLLGGPPNALCNSNRHGGKFQSRDGYRQLLERVFMRAALLLEKDATVYVRTDSREFTHQTTLTVLRRVFPHKQLTEISRPMLGASQTRLFGKANTPIEKSGEVDIILRPR